MDARNFVQCPECRVQFNCGPGGIVNYEKRHRGKKVCAERKAKLDKAASQKKDGSILTFLRKKPTAVPPLTSAPPMVYSVSNPVMHALDLSSTILPLPEARMEPVPTRTSLPPTHIISRLRVAIARIPVTVPEATASDALSGFSGDPALLADSSLGSDDLWENVLNSLIKTYLGWGEEGTDLVRRGHLGLSGLLRFVEYFILERGVSADLFDGKLNHLMRGVENMLVILLSYHEETLISLS